MISISYRLIAGALLAVAVSAQPAITSVENAASNTPPGLPNAAIALGSMFVVKGANLGPSTIVVANSFPLQTSLAGTSVRVTVGDSTVTAIMYYTQARQIAAILPSTAIAGLGTLTVTVNTQISASFPVSVATSNVGMFTLDSTGSGSAVATLGDYSLVSPSNAPNPGEVIVLWATGLGPIVADETRPAPAGEVPVILEAYVGGTPADVLYRGRNPCCSAIDQINIRLPLNVAGCLVPVMLRAASITSNSVTIPIAVSGRNCTPTSPAVTQQDYQRLLARPNLVRGSITLSRNAVTTISLIPGLPPVPSTTRSDDAAAMFQRFIGNTPVVVNTFTDLPNPGSCYVNTAPLATVPVGALLPFQLLDAGASLDINGPAGTKALPRQAISGAISYSATVGAGTARNFYDVGEQSVVGSGGADIGTFNARVTAPAGLNWTNQATLTTISRFLNLTIRWTGGDPGGFVQITGLSATPTTGGNVAASFTCTARAADGFFTVPPFVLLALPPSPTVLGQRVLGSLNVRGVTPAAFSATGLDYGIVTYVHSYTQATIFD